MEGLDAQLEGGKQEEAQLGEEMRRLLTNGWLAPAAGKLNEALQRVVAKNDAAQAQAKAIKAAEDRVLVLQKQMQGGTCPTCHQELPPPDPSTGEDLAEAETDLHQLRIEAGDGPDMPLERRIRGLIDITTVKEYQEKQDRLNKLAAMQFERGRRLGALKDRLKDHDAARIRQLGEEQDQLEQVIEGYARSIRDFKPRQDDINKSRTGRR